MKKLTTLLLGLTLAHLAAANNLAVLDSIGLERRNDQIYILYRVDPGETVYGIAQKYKITTDQLKQHNPSVDLNQVKIGQIIRVPMAMNASFGYSPVVETPQPTKKRIGHMVRAGESLYAIARHYEMEVAYLKKINGLTSDNLAVGQTLMVDMPIKAQSRTVTAITGTPPATGIDPNAPAKEEVPWWAYKEAVGKNNMTAVLHTAEPGETFLSVAKRFNTTVAQLQAWNPGVTDPVPAGKSLKVGETPTVVPPADNSGKAALPGIDASGKIDIPTNKKVVAFGEMIQGNTLTGTDKHLAMHNTAQIGTYIKITNPNNGKATYAKVIARIPASEANKNLVIKLSKETCDHLGISDPKFQVVLEYND